MEKNSEMIDINKRCYSCKFRTLSMKDVPCCFCSVVLHPEWVQVDWDLILDWDYRL